MEVCKKLSALFLLVALFSPFFVYSAEVVSVERVSVSSLGAEADNSPGNVSISHNGRYVAFESRATNLVAGDTNVRKDIFVYDRNTDTIERVSVGVAGAQSNNESGNGDTRISGDGRYVVFQSQATNLVAGGTTGREIFVHDRDTDTTELISKTDAGVEGNNTSWDPSISEDGRYVAFSSLSSNLVAGDTNGEQDIFVFDRDTDTIEMIAPGTVGGSYNTDITDDGRYVAFHSYAEDIVDGGPSTFDSYPSIFVWDRNTDTVEDISVSDLAVDGNATSEYPKISGDGRYVAFYSESTNLVSGDTNGVGDIFLYDRDTNDIEMISVSNEGEIGNDYSNEDYSGIDFSSDGAYVVFSSEATNLVDDDTNSTFDVFVYSLADETISRVSLTDDGSEGNGASYYTSISEDGTFVAFSSAATNLVASDTNVLDDIFVAEISYISAPTLTTSAPTSLSDDNVDMIGNITASGGENSTERGFNYGLTNSYGSTVSETGSFSTGAFSLGVSNLNCGTTYHFRSYAENSAGTGTSSDNTFTTSDCASSSGSSSSRFTPTSIPAQTTQSPSDSSCLPGYLYNPVTGAKCPIIPTTPTSPLNPSTPPLCTLTQTLKLGSTGTEVKCLQAILNILSDGIFGPITKASVINFQKFNNLVPDGIVGPITRKVIKDGL
jgi:hypothetical protein